jgi:hypothetical protein
LVKKMARFCSPQWRHLIQPEDQFLDHHLPIPEYEPNEMNQRMVSFQISRN